MAFYPQFPAIYAYPMPFPNQEFYAMYPGTPGMGGGEGGGPVYYEPPPHNNNNTTKGMHKQGYNNRKDSADSGISDFSTLSSRKTSSTSTISNASIMEEPSLEDVKEETPMDEPDEELCETIVQQVEFYFSDANITKDKFLLKHVKRNKEGFVSLKLISSFKRVKHLTKDWRQVAVAIESKSSKLEVNDLKTKVRRLEALPDYDETTPSRTVVALNLPLERPTIEAVAELFSACGDIVLVRILRPGNPVPADIKPFANKHPEMTAAVCALVEFERTEFALKAVKDLNKDATEAGEPGMKVMELTAPPPKKTKDEKKNKNLLLKATSQPVMHSVQQVQLQPQRRYSHAGFQQQQQMQQHYSPAATAEQQQANQQPRRRISLYHNMKFAPISEEVHHQQQQQVNKMGLNPNAPSFSMQQPMQHRRMRGGPAAGPAAFMPHPMESAMMAAAAMMQPVFVASPRRISAVAAGTAELAASGLALPPNVLRLPRGPDKGKGFQRWCKNRMEPAQPAVAAAAAAAAAAPPLQQRKSRAIPIVAPPPEEEPKKEEKVPEIVVDLVQEQQDEDVAAVDGAAAAAVVVEEAAAVVAAAAAPEVGSDYGSDSGHEDDGEANFSSDHEPEMMENERSR